MTRILYAFFCEDIRVEAGGRVSAIGLWGSGFELRSLPQRIRSIALHLAIANPGLQPHPFKVSISGPGIDKPIETEGELATDADRSTNTLTWLVEGLVISQPGTFVADVEIRADQCISQRVALEVLPPPTSMPTSTSSQAMG